MQVVGTIIKTIKCNKKLTDFCQFYVYGDNLGVKFHIFVSLLLYSTIFLFSIELACSKRKKRSRIFGYYYILNSFIL